MDRESCIQEEGHCCSLISWEGHPCLLGWAIKMPLRVMGFEILNLALPLILKARGLLLYQYQRKAKLSLRVLNLTMFETTHLKTNLIK